MLLFPKTCFLKDATMSQLHDFSDPKTVAEDSDYWRTFYERDPAGADLARMQLLRTKINERYGDSEEGIDFYLKLHGRMQEVNATRTPEGRIAIAEGHLREDVAALTNAWRRLECMLS